MNDLTSRQKSILKALIEEYIETAEPVGSGTLDKKYNLGVSPATIRNEMVALDEIGYLKQPHTSAGRVPTAAAFKLYVNELMKLDELSVAEEVALKEKVWDSRNELSKLLRDTTRMLAGSTNMLSIAINRDNIYYAGTGYILDMPEFYDIDITRNLLLMLDDSNPMQDIFSRISIEDQLSIIFGPDLRNEMFNPYSFIFSKLKTKNDSEILVGVIGPNRVAYRSVVPKVTYCARLLEEIAGW
jgi:heat-inducible transcriptional repressor